MLQPNNTCYENASANHANLIPLIGHPIPVQLTENRPQTLSGRRSSLNSLIEIPIRNVPSAQAKFATVNVRSLPKNMNLIKTVIEERKIDIMCLTETWLWKDELYTTRGFTPVGYSLHRVDRSERTGGGVAVLCHSSLCAKDIT